MWTLFVRVGRRQFLADEHEREFPVEMHKIWVVLRLLGSLSNGIRSEQRKKAKCDHTWPFELD